MTGGRAPQRSRNGVSRNVGPRAMAAAEEAQQWCNTTQKAAMPRRASSDGRRFDVATPTGPVGSADGSARLSTRLCSLRAILRFETQGRTVAGICAGGAFTKGADGTAKEVSALEPCPSPIGLRSRQIGPPAEVCSARDQIGENGLLLRGPPSLLKRSHDRHGKSRSLLRLAIIVRRGCPRPAALCLCWYREEIEKIKVAAEISRCCRR